MGGSTFGLARRATMRMVDERPSPPATESFGLHVNKGGHEREAWTGDIKWEMGQIWVPGGAEGVSFKI